MAMQFSTAADTAQRLGAGRVISPRGSLPQPAERLDASAPTRPYEFEVAVERLCLDSTSHRNIRERANGDPDRMAALITEIVEERGKMHNPETDSGGVLVGTVAEVGENFSDPPEVGDPVVTLSSLTLTPLRLERVTKLEPDSAQVEAEGSAYVFDRGSWAHLPQDMPLKLALEVLDVCSAANQVRDILGPGDSVCVLGCGHAGKLSMAAAREATGGGTVIAVDVDPDAVELVRSLGLCDIGVVTDLRDPVAAVEALQAAGAPRADLTVVVVNVTGCEPTAQLLTADGGSVLFFSMATNFSAAALAGDGIGTEMSMFIGSGFTPDLGGYALDLVRRNPSLRKAMAMETVDAR